jgi:type I phosphodiesterase/nucleotide pyrophosphatase
MADVDQLLVSYAAGRLSRAEFTRRLLALGVSWGFVETLLGSGTRSVLAAKGGGTVSAHSPRVVMVVMDAFRGDYIHLAPMPNLHWLMSRGTFYPHAWVGQLETNTVPSHATLSTGATASHQGVIGFSWRDPVSGKEVYTGWWDDVLAGKLEQQLQQHGVNSIPRAVKVADPTARVVALSSEKPYAADAIGGAAADYILYGHPHGHSVMTRGMPRHLPPPSFLKKKSLTYPRPLRYEQFDEMSMTMALESLQAFDPRVLLINLPGGDRYGHLVGGPATPDVMARIVRGCDRELGRLFTAYRARGLIDETVFVVVGDHGMIPNDHSVSSDDIKRAVREAAGDYLFNTGGSAAYIWLRNPAAAARVAGHLVNAIPHTVLGHYATIESGAYTYHSVVRREAHLPQPLLDAYGYLLGTFASPTAPDVMLTFEENTIITGHQYPHGEHSGPTWGSQHVPLVIAGPGVHRDHVSNFAARLVDVAPTALTALGIEPSGMDGVVLADALADALAAPTSSQEAAQAALAPKLASYREALAARSTADLTAHRAR